MLAPARQRLASPRLAIAVASGLVLLGFFLRVYRLWKLPAGLLTDEAANAIESAALFHGHFPVFFSGQYGHYVEPLSHYIQAVSLKTLGWRPFSLRLPATFLSALTIAATFALGRKLFNARVACFAAFLLGVTFWMVSVGRIGVRRMALPLFAVLALFFLTRWIRRQQPWRSAVLCGLCFGLLLYTYTPGRFFVFVLAAGWLWAFVKAPTLTSRRLLTRARRRLLAEGLLFAAVGLVVFSPLGWYFLQHPADFSARAASLSVFNSSHGDPLANLATSLRQTLLMFSVHGDNLFSKNIPGKPVFDPVVSALFLAGIGIAIYRVRQFAYFIALAWLVIMLAPMAVTMAYMPDSNHAMGIVPALFFFPAIAVEELWRRRAAWRWAALAGACLLTVVSFHDYFVTWAQLPGVASDAGGDWRPGALAAGNSAVAELTSANPPRRVYLGRVQGDDALIRFLVLGWQFDHPGQADRLITYDASETRVAAPSGSQSYLMEPGRPAVSLSLPAQPLAAGLGDAIALEGYSLPATTAPGSAPELRLRWQTGQAPAKGLTLFAHLVDFRQQPLAGFDGNGFPPALWRGGEQVESTFPLTLPATAAPGPYWVDVGAYVPDGTRLRLADGRDSLRLGPVIVSAPAPARPPAIVGSVGGGQVGLVQPRLQLDGGSLRVQLGWLPEARLTRDYSVFVHVLDASGRLVAQADGPPALGRWPSSYWLPGVPVQDDHLVQLGASLAPGVYRIAVGLYALNGGQRLATSIPGPEPNSLLAGHIQLPAG